MEINNYAYRKKKLPKEPESMNFESYLLDDILHNLNLTLSPLEFNLLRIYKYLYIHLKGDFTSSTNYVINGNQITKIIATSRIKFSTSYYKNQIRFDNNIYTIRSKARCFTFYHDDKKNLRFITDQTNLKKVLNEYNMSTFYVKTEQDINISIDDALSVFEDENINELFSKSDKKILSKDNFGGRFSEDLKYIKDISYNSQFYFENSDKTAFIKTNYNNLFENIYSFLSSVSKILYLFGPRSSGKSVFLNFLPYSLDLSNYGSIYLNFNSIRKAQNIINIKNLLYHELLYLIRKNEEIEDLYNMRLFKGINYNNKPLDFIYLFIENLVNKYENDKFSAELIVIIIDDLFIYNDLNEYNTLEKIFGLIDKNERFKIIISGEGKFFFEKIKKFFIRRDSCKEDYILIDKIDEEILKINENKAKKDAIIEELKYLNNFSISNLIYCKNLDGKTLNYLQLKKLSMISVLPNYLTIKFLNDRSEMKFDIENKIFREALNKKIAYNIQKSELKSIMSRNYFPRNVYGISEELLIILLLKYNKFKINSLHFREENLIEVDEINKLKSIYLLDKFKGILNQNDNYLVCQKNYNGENYDLLIIQSLKKSKIAIFVQIGVDKKESDILKQLNDLKDNSKEYLNCLEKYFGFRIDYTSLLYIFDEDTQKELKSPNEKSGSKYCLKHKVDFLVYSFSDNALKKYNNKNEEYYCLNGNDYYLQYHIYEKLNIK